MKDPHARMKACSLPPEGALFAARERPFAANGAVVRYCASGKTTAIS